MLYEKYKLDVPYEKAGLSSEGCEGPHVESSPGDSPKLLGCQLLSYPAGVDLRRV